MARAAILGNGRLAVGINESGFVHDFYFPYVGLDNLTTARSSHHKIGIMVDGDFSWLSDYGWDKHTELRDDFLGSNSVFTNKEIGIKIETTDFVDYEYDAFCRIIAIQNNHDEDRDVKLFMHQVFQISNDGRADTALYVPNQDYILDYKGRTTLLIDGLVPQTGKSFDQYAVGNYAMDGKQGTFMDAVDGELSNNPVEHGGVDSVIRFSLEVEKNSENIVEYWVIASDSQYKCEKINTKLSEGIHNRLNANYMYWSNWLNVPGEKISSLTPLQQSLVKKSLFTIKAHCDSRGGIIASLDSSIYNYGKDYYTYVWPRDGAYSIWPLIRLGYQDEAKAFFRFCENIITNEGYIMHKYQPDLAIGSTWHPLAHPWGEELAIQEDETAVVIFMIAEYMKYFEDLDFIKSLFESIVVPGTNFLANFIDSDTSLPHASYDLWEEKFMTTTYTTACVYGAILSAVEMANKLGKTEYVGAWNESLNTLTSNYNSLIDSNQGTYIKGFLLADASKNIDHSNILDSSSFYGCMIYNFYPKDSSFLTKTVSEIENRLVSSQLLCARYENDNYFKNPDNTKENPWLICTLWLAQYHIRFGDVEKAEKYIQAVESTVYSGGMFPEQVDPNSSQLPLSVTPLVWSHAEYINTILDLKTKK